MKHLLPFLLVFCLPACTGLQKQETLPALEPAVLQFYEHLRWFNGEISKEFVPALYRSIYLDQLDLAERSLQFSSISVIRISPEKCGKKAVVRLRVAWMEKDDNIVHDTLLETRWEYHGKSWFHIKGKVIDGPKIPILFEK